jgi:hypothetical protein
MVIDPLFARAQLAIEESKLFREERRRLINEQESAICELRWTVFESVCVRVESAARRNGQSRK